VEHFFHSFLRFRGCQQALLQPCLLEHHVHSLLRHLLRLVFLRAHKHYCHLMVAVLPHLADPLGNALYAIRVIQVEAH
jgi:hypothetical protein